MTQREGKDVRNAGKEASKSNKARVRGYINKGEVKSLMHYLSVTKREDIRMVYNGMSSGLNNALWATHSPLPMVRNTLRETEEGTYMEDRDIREMFLNFILSKDVRTYCGVDISNMRTEEEWGGSKVGG